MMFLTSYIDEQEPLKRQTIWRLVCHQFLSKSNS